MRGVEKWLLGVAMGGISLLGLVMASGAVDAVFHYVGLLLFLFGVLFNYALIAGAMDGDTKQRRDA